MISATVAAWRFSIRGWQAGIRSGIAPRRKSGASKANRSRSRPTCCRPSRPAFCNWSPAAAGREDHPINCVDWAESQQYCQSWLGGDLPTEAQWEKAARGADPDQRKYPWGDTPLPDCTRCNYDVNGAFGAGAGCGSVTTGPATWPVGNLQTTDGDSAYGLKDMAGNVREWTLDYGSTTFYGQCTAGCTDPLNTTPGGGFRETRGGSYANTTAEIRILRTVERAAYNPVVRLGNIGLRCRRTP
jgi:sulfatase modifying factor 1